MNGSAPSSTLAIDGGAPLNNALYPVAPHKPPATYSQTAYYFSRQTLSNIRALSK